MYANDGRHASLKSHAKIASLIMEYFKTVLARAYATNTRYNPEDLQVLVKPLFSDPSISDEQLTNAMCWTHSTPNWKIPLKQTLDANVTESRGFIYRSPFESRWIGEFRTDSNGGWFANHGFVHLKVRFHILPGQSTPISSRSVAVLLKFKAQFPLLIKIWLNDEKMSCTEIVIKNPSSGLTYIRVVPIATDVSSGYYTLNIEGKVQWLCFLGMAIGYRGFHGYEGYKPFGGTISACSVSS